MDRPPAPLTYHATLLENPDRLVLDFDAAHLKTPVNHIASNLDPVKDIRLAQFTPEISRVVIDMRRAAHYDINSTGNTITIAFDQPVATSTTPRSAEKSNLSTTRAKAQPVRNEE